jgi:transposase
MRTNDTAPLALATRASRRQVNSCCGAICQPCSPDFNPIEQAFAKLKAALRSAAERSLDGLWAAIGRIIDTSRQPSAPATSPPPATMQTDGKTL